MLTVFEKQTLFPALTSPILLKSEKEHRGHRKNVQSKMLHSPLASGARGQTGPQSAALLVYREDSGAVLSDGMAGTIGGGTS